MLVKSILLFFLYITAVIVQFTVLEYSWVVSFSPDLLLVLVTYYANYYGSLPVLIPAFLAGLMRDVLVTTPLGIYAFLYTLLCFLSGYTHKKLFVNSWVSAMILSSFAHALQLIVLFIVILIIRTDSLFQNLQIVEIFLKFLSGTILFIILFILNGLRVKQRF